MYFPQQPEERVPVEKDHHHQHQGSHDDGYQFDDGHPGLFLRILFLSRLEGWVDDHAGEAQIGLGMTTLAGLKRLFPIF